MSYGHNYGGQQYPYSGSGGQGRQNSQDQHYGSSSSNNRLSYMAGDDNSYHTNGQQDVYGALPHRANSTAQRQNNELFMDAGGAAPPPPPRRDTLNASYNPQVYASPTSPYAAGPSSPGILRTPTFSSQTRPYNPAEYVGGGGGGGVDAGMQRMGSTAGYQHGFSPGYPTSNAAGMSMPMPSPGLYQPHHAYATNAPSYSQAPQRPSVSTSTYSPPVRQGSHAHYTPPLPPPLPTIPQSGHEPSADWQTFPSQQEYEDPSRYQPLRSRYDNDMLSASHGGHSSVSPPPAYGGTRSRGSSTSHSQPPTPGPPPPPHGTLSHSSSDYMHSRPLPRVPSNASSPQPHSQSYYSQPSSGFGHRSSDALHAQQDLENEISGMLTSQSPRIEVNSQALNGAVDYSDTDTDPEATAGLEAMREAERQEQEDAARRQSGQRSSFGWAPAPVQEPVMSSGAQHQAPYPSDSDSDVPFADLSSMGGGFDAPMSYGGDASTLLLGRHGSTSDGRSQPISSSGSLRRSGSHSTNATPYPYDEYGATIHPFPAFSAARVDAVGTGGLADPTQFRSRRDSYDEGDDVGMQEQNMNYPGMGDVPDMFYHPGITNRPLPPPPPNEPQYNHGQVPYPNGNQSYLDFPRQPAYAPGGTNYYQSPTAGPGRHTSLHSQTNTPQTLAPARAKTDAEERRRREQRASGVFSAESSAPPSAGASAVALDLPTLDNKFNPAKLRAREFNRCTEPWAMSAIVAWLRLIVEGEQYLKKQPLIDALVALFTYKVPTMNMADAETLSATLVDNLQNEGVLRPEEEWFVFTDTPTSGVIFQLTGVGCYAPKLHEYKSSARCYSHHCQRTEKKIDLSSQPGLKPDEDWATYYKLKREDVEGHDKKEVERQNILHELVQKEENYLQELDVLRQLYRDKLKSANPPLLSPKRIESFLNQVFGKVDSVKRANEEHLLPQMKYRQKEQGPWVVGFSDILREWIRKAKVAYIEYASSYPNAVYKIRMEMERNMLFKTFLNTTQQDPRSRRLGWDHYLKVPITRLQQIGLLLDTVMRRSVVDNEEKRNLAVAIEEIKSVTHECDARVGDGQRKADLTDLQYKLKLRPGMQGRVELNLDHLGRELVHKGDLLRIGSTRFNWVETHAILFDHYLVLAKTTRERSTQDASTYERYDVSRSPIPMDLLVLESRDDLPVIRSSLTGRAGVVKVQAADPRLMRAGGGGMSMSGSPSPGQLLHSNTSTSLNSLTMVKSNASQANSVTSLDGAAGKDSEKLLYPFRIKHLGQEVYTLYAYSDSAREDWVTKIIEAKTKHAAALFAQNAEPFKLRVIADSAFAYEGTLGGGASGGRGIVIKGTPLDRAIREVEKRYRDKGRPGPVCRARVNCATAFTQRGGPGDGKSMVAVGTDYGVFISTVDNPRGWQRVSLFSLQHSMSPSF